MIDLRLLLAESLGERYRVVRELTGGGMSRVFLAEEVALNRDVVVKVLSPDLVGAQHLERFRQEILQTARLQHPSIVPILSVGMLRYPTGAAAPYYIMPYIRGETLRSRLEREGPFSTSSILRVLRDVLEALVHAHRHGVIHRDIKPENIFISGGHAVVTDFGIAKAVSSAGDSPANTLPGVAVGTPAYMAPEQAAGDDGVDQRSDLYALGVVAYELLTGHAPFAGQSTRQLIVAHVRSTPEPLGQRRPDLPPMLANAVMRCMEKAPEQRWQTADELLRVLEGIRSSDPHLTASRELPAGATPRSRQARWVGGLAVAAAAVAGWLLLGSPDSPRRPIQPKISVMVMSPDVIGDSALHEFARAMQTELTHYLQRLGLSVLDAHASDGMLRLTNQEKAERLGAAFLVTTSLNRDSNGIRAIVNLTDDRMVLQDVWDYSLPDADPRRALEALVDSAATDLDGRLPAAVRQASLPGTADQVLERRSLSPEIAGLVERADSGVRTRTRSGLLQSIALLGEALTQDPGNGYLHARMSSAYALVTVYQ